VKSLTPEQLPRSHYVMVGRRKITLSLLKHPTSMAISYHRLHTTLVYQANDLVYLQANAAGRLHERSTSGPGNRVLNKHHMHKSTLLVEVCSAVDSMPTSGFDPSSLYKDTVSDRKCGEKIYEPAGERKHAKVAEVRSTSVCT